MKRSILSGDKIKRASTAGCRFRSRSSWLKFLKKCSLSEFRIASNSMLLAKSFELWNSKTRKLRGFRIPIVPKPKLQLAPFLIASSTSNNARNIAQLDQPNSGATRLASLPRTTPKRFKPLTVTKSNRVNAPTSSNVLVTASNLVESPKERTLPLDQEPSGIPQPGNTSMYYLELRAAQDLMKSLTPITRPPSLSQRKLVNRWAIILSGLSDAERKACVQVSRGFRYASKSTQHFYSQYFVSLDFPVSLPLRWSDPFTPPLRRPTFRSSQTAIPSSYYQHVALSSSPRI